MMTSTENDRPWKTDLARKAAQRREQVLHEVEETIKKAPSFEEALRQAVELLKKKFADGENLAVHIALDRPDGPERVRSDEGPLAEAARQQAPTVVVDLVSQAPWEAIGLTTGSAAIAPIRTDAGLWAILEIWSDFRDAFKPQDVTLLSRVAAALARKTPAA